MKVVCMIALFSLMVLYAGTAVAESAQGAHAAHMSGSEQKPMSDASREYMKSMEGMHNSMMDGVMASDPDEAFVRGMIPHHEGAVAMARIQLKYGKDPELRKLAQQIIDAQETEIRYMQEWLRTHGKKK